MPGDRVVRALTVPSISDAADGDALTATGPFDVKLCQIVE
jgi:hypothetical protein